MSYKLQKPYTLQQRFDFISSYSLKGLRFEETKKYIYALEPWEELQGDVVIDHKKEWEEEQLKNAKEKKYQEANIKANDFLDGGNALYELEPTKHIEATDKNIGKLHAYVNAIEKGLYKTIIWNTKEDELIELNTEQIWQILAGIAIVQSNVWTIQYPEYVKQIEKAKTIEQVNSIVIEYK